MASVSLAVRATRCSLLAALVALLAAQAVPAPVQAADPTPVSLRLDIFFYGTHVPLLAGIVDGTFEKHGLKVTAVAGRGSATTLQTVANRSDDFGFADGGTLVKLAAQGLKAKLIVGILQTSPMVVITMSNSGLTKLTDLNGKTGGFTPESSPEQIFPALASKVGIDLKSIKKISVDLPTRDSIFLLRKTDFSFGYAVTQVPLLQERCKCILNVIRYADHGIVAIGNGIVASNALIAEKPGVVREFAAATVESIAKAVKNPDEAVNLFFKYVGNKTNVSREVISQQWRESVKVLKTETTKDKGYGYLAESDWQKTIQLLVKYGGVLEGKVTPAMVYTNEFLPK